MKQGIRFDRVAERRDCDVVAGAASSCFQLYYPPTVGGQVLMGLPVLARLRHRFGAGLAVWPFQPWRAAPVVLAEIWPGLIEGAVKAALGQAGKHAIRDREQVRLLARALAALHPGRLAAMLDAPPQIARREEGWILGAGHEEELEMATQPGPLRPPPLTNDCFALPQGVSWTPVDEALAALRARLRPVTGVEEVAVMQASNRVLATDVAARRANPAHPNTAVDGYGFAAATLPEGEEVVLPLVAGRAAAGAPFDGAVPAGHAVRILTGALLPEGVDTVVLEEDTRSDGARVAFRASVKPGANTRRAGEDVPQDATCLRAGRVLTPADLALAAATGHGVLPVRARLRGGRALDRRRDRRTGKRTRACRRPTTPTAPCCWPCWRALATRRWTLATSATTARRCAPGWTGRASMRC